MAIDDDLAFLSVTEQARLVRTRVVSSRELTAAYLDRIDTLDPILGSYVEVLAERASQDATAADERTSAGEATGPLHGVPVSIKDTNFLRGARTTLGTRAFADHVATYDDHAVDRLLAAGAIALGKTNVPELGTIGHTDTRLLGACSTPWEPGRNAGGSSGGAGAALAAGLCALSQGSDGAGSIRIPAAINGVVGLKPARDRISGGPLFGESAFGLSTAGALTRTVADAALALDVMAGNQPGDPGYAPPPPRPWSEEVGSPTGTLQLGICRQTPFTDGGLHPSVEAALERTVALLEDAGHRVEELTLPIGGELVDHVLTLWAAGLSAQPIDPATFEPVNRWLAEVGASRSAGDYGAAQFRVQASMRRLVRDTSHLDAMVLPTLTGPSRPNGIYDGWDGEAIFRDQTALVGLTPLANLSGQPAISLPIHHDESVGPVGVTFVGRPLDEAGLLRLAAQLEQAVGWATRRPPMATGRVASGEASFGGQPASPQTRRPQP